MACPECGNVANVECRRLKPSGLRKHKDAWAGAAGPDRARARKSKKGVLTNCEGALQYRTYWAEDSGGANALKAVGEAIMAVEGQIALLPQEGDKQWECGALAISNAGGVEPRNAAAAVS